MYLMPTGVMGLLMKFYCMIRGRPPQRRRLRLAGPAAPSVPFWAGARFIPKPVISTERIIDEDLQIGFAGWPRPSWPAIAQKKYTPVPATKRS
jgi:hypothetical protein